MESLRAALVGAERADRDLDETEAGLNALIERRARDREDANATEAAWAESVRAHHAEHREARRYLWIHYYRQLAESFRKRSEECAEKAAALGDPSEAREPGGGR